MFTLHLQFVVVKLLFFVHNNNSGSETYVLSQSTRLAEDVKVGGRHCALGCGPNGYGFVARMSTGRISKGAASLLPQSPPRNAAEIDRRVAGPGRWRGPPP